MYSCRGRLPSAPAPDRALAPWMMLIGIDVPSSLPARGATVSVPEAMVPGAAVTGPTANGCAIAAGAQSRVVSMHWHRRSGASSQ